MRVITDFKIHSLIESINEALDKSQVKRLKSDLKVYCDEVGSDFDEVCKLLKLQAGSLSKLTSEQIQWLNKAVSSGTWDLNEETGKIDVESNTTTYWRKDFLPLGSIPFGIQFGKFQGSIYAAQADLESLAGFPDEIIGNLNISSNKLTSLKGCPKIIKGDLNCSSNKLENLKGGPDEVRQGYNCNGNYNLTSLDGAPEKIGGDFNLNNCSLETLKGGPIEVTGDFTCKSNKLITMEGAPEVIDGYNVDCSENRLYTLEGLPLEFRGNVACAKNLFPGEVLKTVYSNAKKYESWVGAYLVLLTTKRFQRMSKDQRDPIRKTLSGDALKTKSLQLSKIWKDPIMDDPAVKRMIKRADLGQDVVQDVELGSDLKDIGF
jgi:hypothetical protein